MNTPPRPPPSPALGNVPVVRAISSPEVVRPRLWTRPFARLVAVQGCFGLAFSSFQLLPTFLVAHHATAEDIGLVTAMWGAAGVAVSPLVGPLLDRYGRRPFIVTGTALMASSAFAFALAGGSEQVAVALRFVQGVAFTLVFNGVMALVADRVAPSRLGAAIGLAGAATLVTNAIAPVAVERIVAVAGWGSAFTVAGGCSLGALVVAWKVRDPERVDFGAGDVGAGGLRPTSLLRRAGIWGVFIGDTACGIGYGTLTFYQQPYALQLGFERVSDFFVAYAVVALTVRLLLGGVIDRIGPRPMAIGALVFYAIAVAAGADMSQLGLWPLGAGLGVAHGLFFPSVSALAVRFGGPQERGRIMALLNMAFSLGMAVSLFAFGVLAAHVGFAPVFLVAGAAIISAVAVVASLTRSASLLG